MSAESEATFDAVLAGGGEQATPPDELVRVRQRLGWLILGAGASVAIGTVLLIASVSALSSSGEPEVAPLAAAPSQAAALPASPAPAQTAEAEKAPPMSVDETWVREYAKTTGIPPRALSAYAAASVRVSSEVPDCALGWNTLAGIGQVESHHGTIHGSHLDGDGVATPAIIGIPLTGETTQAIRDTDDGELDGDTQWDRAVGPMQFIPTTWAEWGSDGNGDGKADPQNIDDSALSAARYLCNVGGNLDDPSNWIAAVHAYNPTVEYNNLVAEAAEQYGSF